MLDKTSRSITVNGYRTEQNNTKSPIAEKIFSARFHCENCKNICDCKNTQNCAFVKYICDRISSTVYEYNIKNPELTIIMDSTEGCKKAMQVVKRAKKLRSYGYCK